MLLKLLFNTWGRGHTVCLKYSSPVVESVLVDVWRQEKNKSQLTFLLLQQNWPKSPFIKYCCKWPPGEILVKMIISLKSRFGKKILNHKIQIYPLHSPQNSGDDKILVLNGRSLGDKSMDGQNYFPSFL